MAEGETKWFDGIFAPAPKGRQHPFNPPEKGDEAAGDQNQDPADLKTERYPIEDKQGHQPSSKLSS